MLYKKCPKERHGPKIVVKAVIPAGSKPESSSLKKDFGFRVKPGMTNSRLTAGIFISGN
ncbi:MAG: hypothetical protein AB1306_03205 [Nitrospirota bacterium]